MRTKTFLTNFCFFTVLTLLLGCLAPQQEIETAKSKIDEAKNAHADLYAPEQFKAATDSLDAALAEVEAQNAKVALTRNYDRAKDLLQSTTLLAQSATDAAKVAMDQARTEAQALLAQVQTAVEETKGLLGETSKNKAVQPAVERFRGDLTLVETVLSEAKAAMDSGDYLAARDKTKIGLEKVNMLNEEVKQTIAKKGRVAKKVT